MEHLIVEKTFGNGSTLIHLEDYETVMRNIADKHPSKRYFKLPPVSELEEVLIEVKIGPAK